ncbi:MAG TPA: hypothetical protein VLA93_12685 [Pyrinomonadaceae bacterium]|nr:hypothetical protein [Pyrinomonadaceae bacterium]
MRGPTKLDLHKLLEPENRGILLDLVVFFLNLTLMIVLTRLTKNLVNDAETDVTAKALIGFYFAGLFLLQPLGPVLKRWSVHHESQVDTGSAVGCLLFWFMFFYLVMMLSISSIATIMLTEVIFEPGTGGEIGTVLILVGFFWSIFNTIVIYRYFLRPKKPPRWKFLMTHQSAILGDVCMFLNVIALQILWNNLTTAESFWQNTLSTPLGRPGSFTDILGRFIVIAVLAMLVYFPGRIFYLAENPGRKITWLTMLVANLPLLLRAVFSAPR